MKSALDYTKSRVQAILHALEKYHQFEEIDSLHRIRVEIKKLKSVILLLGYASRKFDAHEHYLSLRNIFRKAGQIRQPSILIELMLLYGVEGMPVEQLGDARNEAGKFRADVPFYMTQVKKVGRRLKPRLKKLRKRDVAGYVKELEKFIHGSFVPRFNPRKFHTARKRMKQVVYLTGLSDRLSNVDRKFYGKMESAIGGLHDKEILLDFLAGMPRRVATAPKMVLRKQITAERRAIVAEAKAFYRTW